MDLEEVFKTIVVVIFGIILLGALADFFNQLNLSGFYSFMIGFVFIAIIIAFLDKILKEFGGF